MPMAAVPPEAAGSGLCQNFGQRMVEDLRLHLSSAAITKIEQKGDAVCRLAGRGSGVLVCREAWSGVDREARSQKKLPPAAPGGEPVVEPDLPLAPQVGVLLTTAFVLPNAAVASGTRAVFDEKATGRRAECRLLPSVLYYNSAADRCGDGDSGEVAQATLGYVIVAVELHGISGGLVRHPGLGLPLSGPWCAPLKVADTCLMVEHPNGLEPRKYHLTQVSKLTQHHATHAIAQGKALDYFSAGAAVFNEDGVFVGIGQVVPGAHATLHLPDIVAHLFHSRMLKHLVFEIADSDTSEQHCTPQCDSAEHLFVPLPLHQPPPVLFAEEIWKNWFDSARYQTIVLLLHGFLHCRALVIKALTELTGHSQRGNVGTLHQLDCIPTVLDVLHVHREDAPVVEQALAALSRSVDHADNLRELDAQRPLPVVFLALEHHRDSKRAAQWGCFLLCALVGDGAGAPEANKEGFVALGGFAWVKGRLADFGDDLFVVRWAVSLLRRVVEGNAAFVELAVDPGVTLHVCLLDMLKGMCETTGATGHAELTALEALLRALCGFVGDPAAAVCRGAAQALFEAGTVEALRALLVTHAPWAREAVLHHACVAVRALATAYPPSVAGCIREDVAGALRQAAAACPSSARVVKEVLRASAAIGAGLTPSLLSGMP
ncbi:hypothetical protein DIPPA_32476 [Diplonema papillatum]|nr:hypothetical protein DIPPA_32476 [Diplonema papillatum]